MFISGCDDSDMNGSDPNCCSSSSEWSKRVAFITLIGGGSWKPGDPPTTPSPRGLLDHNPINSNLCVIHHLSTIQPISKYCDKTVDQINPSSLHQRHLSGGNYLFITIIIIIIIFCILNQLIVALGVTISPTILSRVGHGDDCHYYFIWKQRTIQSSIDSRSIPAIHVPGRIMEGWRSQLHLVAIPPLWCP